MSRKTSRKSRCLETLARTLRSRVRGESTLKGLVKGAQSRSSDASCEASLLLPFSFTFVDSLTVERTSTELEAVARFLSLRSRALGESTLKGLVIGALVWLLLFLFPLQKTHQNDGTSFKRKSGKTPNSTNIIAIVTAATPQQ